MAYHTSLYLFLFLPAVLLIYQITPKKMRWAVLLTASYGFFWLISKGLLIYLVGTTVWIHYVGLWIDAIKIQGKTVQAENPGQRNADMKKRYKKKEKIVLIAGCMGLLAPLIFLKYYNFLAENINTVLQWVESPKLLELKTLLLPIGISFYTLQAIGYLADVYWEKIPVQRNLGKLALFLGFFPQIMEGPISMYAQTADALWKGNSLRAENLAQGSLRILWGLFKKMIVADRLYVLVEAVFNNSQDYHGVVIVAAAVAYTVQLYMEFSGCMDIVIGSGRMFGVKLPENFRQPFASRNAAEFWRRWHITLGVWFKTYVFYPVSVSAIVKKWNRFGRKHLGKYLTKLGVSAIALFPVWFCNGLWHGPRWSYLFYGMYYFVILLTGIAVEPVREKVIKKFHIREEALYWKLPQILKTWVIIFTGELFFRADGLRRGLHMFQSIFRDFDIHMLWDGTFLTFGLDKADYLAIGVGCIIAAVVGQVKEKNLLGERGMQTVCLPVRWAVYYGLIVSVIMFGAYGIGYQKVDLIYAGF